MYQPNDSDAFEELASGGGRGDGENVTAASVCELPSLEWEGLWESLIYADDIKFNLLNYIYTTVNLSDADIDREFATVDLSYSAFKLKLDWSDPSQYRVVEQVSPFSWTTWHGKDLLVSCASPKTFHTTFRQVCMLIVSSC